MVLSHPSDYWPINEIPRKKDSFVSRIAVGVRHLAGVVLAGGALAGMTWLGTEMKNIKTEQEMREWQQAGFPISLSTLEDENKLAFCLREIEEGTRDPRPYRFLMKSAHVREDDVWKRVAKVALQIFADDPELYGEFAAFSIRETIAPPDILRNTDSAWRSARRPANIGNGIDIAHKAIGHVQEKLQSNELDADRRGKWRRDFCIIVDTLKSAVINGDMQGFELEPLLATLEGMEVDDPALKAALKLIRDLGGIEDSGKDDEEKPSKPVL